MSSAAVEAWAGGLGSLVALLSTYPLKTIYTLQAIEARRRGHDERASLLALAAREPRLLLHHALARARELDVRGLYTGLRPAAIETVASTAVYFYFYSLLRHAVVARKHRRCAAAGPPALLCPRWSAA
jgi:adenine nucleotide transporter 17